MARRRAQALPPAPVPEKLARFHLPDWWDPAQDPEPPTYVTTFSPGTLPVSTLEERLRDFHTFRAWRRYRDACEAWEAEHGPIPHGGSDIP
jgi:hypothetical protein